MWGWWWWWWYDDDDDDDDKNKAIKHHYLCIINYGQYPHSLWDPWSQEVLQPELIWPDAGVSAAIWFHTVVLPISCISVLMLVLSLPSPGPGSAPHLSKDCSSPSIFWYHKGAGGPVMCSPNYTGIFLAQPLMKALDLKVSFLKLVPRVSSLLLICWANIYWQTTVCKVLFLDSKQNGLKFLFCGAYIPVGRQTIKYF